jgi:prepilin-type processing-associated H-X9-DG protein
MNANLQGKRYHQISLPEDTVMVYEGKAQRILFRHDRRAAVGMADGSVRLVNESQSRTLRWIP